MGRALFFDGKTRVFVRCGRKWGKTEFIAYFLYRLAGITPNGQFYYVAPFYNQASEIIWHPGRLQDFLGKHAHKYIDNINDTEKRITLKNGSFLKLVGADNHQAGRGFNPNAAAFDEFKDHDPRFKKGFIDNLITKKGPLLITGTPPETHDHFFVRTEEDFKNDPRGAYFKMPQSANPYIDKEEQRLEKESAIRRGEWAEHMREVEAEIVPGGANAIFPMIEIPRYDAKGNFEGESRHVKKHDYLLKMVQSTARDWDYHMMCDPGSSLCFAVLCVAIHRAGKMVVVLGEVYEKDRKKTSTKQIWPRVQEMMDGITKKYDWYMGYDNAATWFANEVQNEYEIALTPCTKDVGGNKKDNKLSVIKDFLLEDLYLISDNCPHHISEMSTYATDEHGKIPKVNDHTIDDIRYIFNAAGLDTIPKTKFKPNEDFRIYKDDNNYEYEEDIPIDIYSLEEEFDI